jgi:hypothetical protein
LEVETGYQANRLGYLFISNDKVRNARGANSTTAVEATTQQFSDKRWGFANPTHQLQHTLVATDKLVFNNMLTYVGGGFFLDYQDFDQCGESRYVGATNPNDYITGRAPAPTASGTSSRCVTGRPRLIAVRWWARTKRSVQLGRSRLTAPTFSRTRSAATTA